LTKSKDEQRATRAKQLLDDELLNEALESLEADILEEWRNNKRTSDREELWHTLKGIDRFRTYLTIVLEKGSIEKQLAADYPNIRMFS